MKPFDYTPQKLEDARLHIETEMVRRTGGSDPPGDRLDTVTDMLLILVDKYRSLGKLLVAAVVLLALSLGGLVHMTIGYFEVQRKMEQLQADQTQLLAQQRETRKAVSETKDKLDKTSQTVTETKEVVEKAVEAVPTVKPKSKR